MLMVLGLSAAMALPPSTPVRMTEARAKRRDTTDMRSSIRGPAAPGRFRYGTGRAGALPEQDRARRSASGTGPGAPERFRSVDGDGHEHEDEHARPSALATGRAPTALAAFVKR